VKLIDQKIRRWKDDKEQVIKRGNVWRKLEVDQLQE
jgi:hypothetical protein